MGFMMSKVRCAMPLGTVYGDRFDVVASELVLGQLIMIGVVTYVWFGIQCRSMSFARWPPLRDTAHVRGFPKLKPHQEDIVRVGNLLVDVTMRLVCGMP